MEVISKNQAKNFIREELEKIRLDLYKELDKIRVRILKLEEENEALKKPK